jgi:anti-sigma B factor antagonist
MSTASLSYEDLSDTIRRVALTGRLDMVGMEEIDLKFTSITAARPLRVIVDLTGVTFLASIGIRSIISSARALDQKGGKMVLVVGDNATVRATLEATGIGTVVPLLETEDEAALAVMA